MNRRKFFTLLGGAAAWSRPSTDALTLVRPSRNAVTMLTTREMRTIARMEAVRYFHRLGQLSLKTNDIEKVLAVAKEVFNRAMGPVDAYTSHEDTVMSPNGYATREDLVKALQEQGFRDADRLLPPSTLIDVEPDKP